MVVTTRDILDHLMNWYSNITAANLKAIEACINENFDHSRPIDVFSQHIYDAIQNAHDGRNLFTAKEILQTKFHSINATRMYKESCKEWQQKGDANKTWTNFKCQFATEYHKICEQQRVSVKVEFNSAHLAHETTDTAMALDNLALGTTENRNIVANLIAINKKLVETNTVLVSQVKSLVATNARLANTQGTKYHIYCWSHGLKLRMGHRSITYGGELQGHRYDATQTNTLNGKMWNKPNY